MLARVAHFGLCVYLCVVFAADTLPFFRGVSFLVFNFLVLGVLCSHYGE